MKLSLPLANLATQDGCHRINTDIKLQVRFRYFRENIIKAAPFPDTPGFKDATGVGPFHLWATIATTVFRLSVLAISKYVIEKSEMNRYTVFNRPDNYIR